MPPVLAEEWVAFNNCIPSKLHYCLQLNNWWAIVNGRGCINM